MMRVRCVKGYNDLQLKRLVNVGEELEVNEDRADQLIIAKVCEELATPTTPEVATKAAPKKSKKKAEG